MAAELKENQQKVLKQFINRTGKLIENGYAYAFAHPEVVQKLMCESNKIQEIEKLSKERKNPCYEKMLRDSYIRYFVMLTKLGLKYVHHHPDYYNDVVKLQSFFADYDNKTFVIKSQKKIVESSDEEDSTDNIFYETHQQLNELCTKIDLMKNRIEKMNNEKPKCVLKKSLDGMRLLNKELKAKLRQIKQEKKSRIQHFREATGDSDEISSEEVLNFDDLNQMDQHLPQPQLPSKLTPARIGPIQRNIVIPLKGDYPDGKITPKYIFKRDDNGKMTFDVQLNFENGVLYNDRVADGIYIKNNLPLPAQSTRRWKKNLFN